MFKKIVTAFVSIAVMASLGVTALADPAGSPAPTASNDTSDEFIAKVKAMREQVNVLRAQLQSERKLDQQIRSQIRSLKGIVTPDPAKVAAYQAEIKPLTAKLKVLTQQLAKENRKKGKNRDRALIEKLKADIKTVQAQIAAVNETYKDLIAQIKTNKSGRSSLKPLRQQLQPMYAALRPLVAEAKTFNRSVNQLTVDMRKALKANDVAKATELLNQILAKMEQLEQNIAKRIEIRKQMTKVLDDYKATIQ